MGERGRELANSQIDIRAIRGYLIKKLNPYTQDLIKIIRLYL